MRRIIPGLLALAWLLACASSAGALLLSAGDVATYSFGFPDPQSGAPYNDLHYAATFTALVGPGSVTVSFFTDLADPLGSAFHDATPAAWGATGSLSFENGGYYPGGNMSSAVDTGQIFGSLSLNGGSIDVSTFSLFMSINGTKVTDFVGGQLVSVSPVPEPGTLLLLGTGLAGLAGLRRKLKK
jgi:PEP-CTERM motif